jgi:hypothetical protein
MKQELEQKIVQRWPEWFDVHGDIRRTLMPCGFEHGDGWFDILWRLCVDLEPLVADLEQNTGEKFEVLQVKEKFGGLRFYVNIKNDVIHDRIYAAQEESFHTCEVCGQPGTRREGNGGAWIKTFCKKHAKSASNSSANGSS